MLPHGDMEGPFIGGLAAAWSSNSYGDNQVYLAPETTDVRQGTRAQRITCTRFRSGGAQIYFGHVSVEAGTTYTLRLWMKGDIASPVFVGVRQHAQPYTAYISRSVRVTPEWRSFVVSGEAAGTDSNAGVYLMFASLGYLLVDGVSLVRAGPSEAPPGFRTAVRRGNLVYNSGFELGAEGWASENMSIRTEASAGQQFARAIHRLESRPFPVSAGQRYSVSARIRAEAPGTRVTLGMSEWADDGGDDSSVRDGGALSVVVGTDWRRYRLTHLAAPRWWGHYVATVESERPIHIDDVQVEEGDPSLYRPAHATEVTAATSTRWSEPGQRVEILTRISGRSEDRRAVTYTLLDIWSRPVARLHRRLRGAATDRAFFAPRDVGVYRVRAQVAGSGSLAETWFGVLPNAEMTPPEAGSQFGVHLAPREPVVAVIATGARWVRLHDFGSDFCHWYRVEPMEGGPFSWFDAEIDELRRRGFSLLANLGHPPAWAGSRSKSARAWTPEMPRSLTSWERYVFETARHYAGRIRYWEIWNEPYQRAFFEGTPADYVELLRVAYRAIKRADPDAVVIGSLFSPGAEAWSRSVIELGALEYVDAVSYHVYWTPSMAEADTAGKPPDMTERVRGYQTMMAARGLQKPIYMTEGGVRAPPIASWIPLREGIHATSLEATNGLVKGIAEMLSARVVKVFYYDLGPRPPWHSTIANGAYGLMDYSGRPKATMVAYAVMTRLLAAAEPVSVIRSSRLTVHLFRQRRGAVAIVWTARTRTPAFPRTVQAIDLMGNRMRLPVFRAGEAVYVRAPEMAPEQLLRLAERLLGR
jgi:hypothetical protein